MTPAVEVEGWWTSLAEMPEAVIAHYCYHGIHEQFHSEIKTDLDLERLPSGKFGTNDAMLHLGMFAYNCLRLIGQLGLTGNISPVKHPAKRHPLTIGNTETEQNRGDATRKIWTACNQNRLIGSVLMKGKVKNHEPKFKGECRRGSSRIQDPLI